MQYHTTDPDGISEIAPSPVRQREILEAVADSGAPHPDAALMHATGWTLTYTAGGVLLWEHNRGRQPTRMRRDVSLDEAWGLWQTLARGEVERIEKEAWQPLG